MNEKTNSAHTYGGVSIHGLEGCECDRNNTE